MTRRRKVILALGTAVALVAVLLVTRGDDDGGRRAPLTPTSTRADLSGVEIAGVEGTTTTTAPVNQGVVRITGQVRTPEGVPVPGAMVRAEWWRVNPPQIIEVLTDDQGRFEIRDVAGGRWKIRGWRTPDYATGKVEEIFLDEKAERDLTLEVREVEEVSVTWDVEPDPPITDYNAELAVVVVERTVDVEGRTVTTPITGTPVTLQATAVWQRVRGDVEQDTDGAGKVTWILRCRDVGSHDLSVQTLFGTHRLDLPDCIPITATSTTSTLPPETTTT